MRWSGQPKPTAAHTIYATIIVKRPPYLTGRATPPHRQNQPDVAHSQFRLKSETANYNSSSTCCQVEDGSPVLIQFRDRVLESDLHSTSEPRSGSDRVDLGWHSRVIIHK